MKLLKWFSLALVVLFTVLAINTLRFITPEIGKTDFNPVDVDASIHHELTQAIAIKTLSTSDDVQFQRLHALLRSNYPKTFAQLIPFNGHHNSIGLLWQGSDSSLKPAAWLAHLDVVPADPSSLARWKHPPYLGVVDDGHIWGRGAIDDKGSVIAILHAIEKLISEGHQPKRSLFILLGHDEEIGGEQGAKGFVTALKQRDIKLAYALDEGGVITRMVPGVNQPVALIGTSERGYLSLELTATDTGGHSSTPTGSPAIFRLAQGLSNLANHPFEANLKDIRGTMKAISTQLPWYYKVVFANDWLFSPVIDVIMQRSGALNAGIRTTIAPTMLNAGVKDNVLPTQASAVINLRLFPGDSPEMAIQKIVDLVNDESIEIRQLGEFASAAPDFSNTDSPFFHAVATSIHQSYDSPISVAPRISIGATDIRHYTSLTDNHYRFLAVDVDQSIIDGFHGVNERISTASLENMVRFYFNLAKRHDEVVDND